MTIAGGVDENDRVVVTEETLVLHKPLKGFDEMGTRVRAKVAEAGSIDSATPTTTAAIVPPT